MLTLDGEFVCIACKELLQHNKTNVLIKKKQQQQQTNETTLEATWLTTQI